MADQEQHDRRQISLRLPEELISRIDALKGEFGCRSRGAIVERLLQSLLSSDEEHPGPLEGPLPSESLFSAQDLNAPVAEVEPAPFSPPAGGHGHSGFDERGALVLRAGAAAGDLVLDGRLVAGDPDQDHVLPGGSDAAEPVSRAAGGRGIDLPGFVQRRTEQLRRSLHPNATDATSQVEPLPQVPAARIASALARAEAHWHELYGKPANDAVLEAAMLWMAQDVWPQSDQSEGRPFTWSLAGEVMRQLSPEWPQQPPSFSRVMVMAGVLEDPFSSATLELRIPTVIRRFVHRFRRRRPGANFQTLEHTMTLHGALKLLQLPTDPGQRLTLPQIREAYRDMALAHHPDAGGSEETMRRLNEAYQLLKELYRTR